MKLRTLGNYDDERPTLRVVANGRGQADLCLPPAFSTALTAPVQKQDDWPLLVIIALKSLWQIDLKVICGAVELKSAIEEACLLKTFRMGEMRGRTRVRSARRDDQRDQKAARHNSQDATHMLTHHRTIALTRPKDNCWQEVVVSHPCRPLRSTHPPHRRRPVLTPATWTRRWGPR